MNIKSLNFISIILLAGCAGNPPKMTGPYMCPPDNRPVFVYSDPSQAYKELAISYEVNLEGLKGTLKEYNATIGLGELEVKKKVESLQEKLDQKNITHQNNLKAIVISLQTNPCNDIANQRFFEYLTLLNNNAKTLEELNSKLQNDLNKGDLSNGEKTITEINDMKSVDGEEIKDSGNNENTTSQNVLIYTKEHISSNNKNYFINDLKKKTMMQI